MDPALRARGAAARALSLGNDDEEMETFAKRYKPVTFTAYDWLFFVDLAGPGLQVAVDAGGGRRLRCSTAATKDAVEVAAVLQGPFEAAPWATGQSAVSPLLAMTDSRRQCIPRPRRTSEVRAA